MDFKRIIIWGLFWFLLFIFVSLLVNNGLFNKPDLLLTITLQNYIPRVLDLPFSLLSLIGSFEIIGVVLFWISFYLFRHKYYYLSFGSIFFVLGHIIELLGKYILLHPSPPLDLYRGIGLVSPTVYIHTNYSFPSGHMFRTAYLGVFLVLLLNSKIIKLNILKNKVIIFIFLILMIISRIYLGEHWLSDVIGGLLLGISFGLLAFSFNFFDNKAKS